MIITDLILSVLSGILLVLAFPHFNVEILSCVALVPWLWAIRKKSPSRASLLGFVTGLVFFSGLLYWIYNVLTEYGHLPAVVSIIFLMALAAYLALYFSVFSFLLRWAVEKTGLSEFFFAPPLWVSLEYLRGFLFSGFPWELLGYSQFLTLPLVQIADTTGVYGISFLIVLINVALSRLAAGVAGREWKSALQEVLAGVMVLALTGIYGHYRLMALDQQAKEEKPLRVALIQGNIRQDVKWDPQYTEV